MTARLLKGKYYGLGRVIGSHYQYEPGTPASIYNSDNPTGYMTGQCIDVEVLEASAAPTPFRQRVFSPGEVVRGFWSYGGDNGIVGKPNVGDLVGYFQEPYANVWEKVSDTGVDHPVFTTHAIRPSSGRPLPVLLRLWIILLAAGGALLSLGAFGIWPLIHQSAPMGSTALRSNWPGFCNI